MNKKWFESQLITIKCESGYFLSISLPNSLSHNLAFHSGFSVKKFIKRNNFIVIEKTTEFTGLGRFYSDDIDEKKILSDLVNFFHDIYIIDNEKFHFEIMSTNKT